MTTPAGEAFADLVRTEKDRVFRVALSVLGPGRAADAEDVAQEVFVRAHRALPSFRGESRLGTWLYRMAFNRAVDHRRRLRRRAEAPLEEPGAEARDRRAPIAGPWRWLLHTYWAAAAAASLWILDRLDLGAAVGRLDEVAGPVLTALILTAAGAILPFFALRRSGGSLLGLLRRAL